VRHLVMEVVFPVMRVAAHTITKNVFSMPPPGMKSVVALDPAVRKITPKICRSPAPFADVLGARAYWNQ